jgi:hypothetical protein
LKEGVYELHLYFAETVHGLGPTEGGELKRRFDVSLNGTRVLSGFDIALDAAGSSVADEKVFKDVSPAKDGFLHLVFSGGEAILNGIGILPGTPGKTLPIRIICGNNAYSDRAGRLWRADQYFAGGRIVELTRPVRDREDQVVYSSYRTGNFTYAIPVADGTYSLHLRFAEPVWTVNRYSERVGRRRFDVYCNGKALVEGLDIAKQADAGRDVEKTLRGLKPNAQGKLLLSFVPVASYAVLFALEVVSE